MSATHNHGHAHHGHSHGVTNERRVAIAMWITGGFMVVEALGGYLSGSLALIADAGHMLTDTGALALAWLAVRFARRPADDARSYGYHRAEILAAFLNGAAMMALAWWVIFEAAMRFMEPAPVLATPMLVVAAGGLLVNIASFWMLHGAGDSLNMRGAAVHVLGDLFGSVAAIAAAIVILLTGWMPIDPILSVFVALLILRSAWNVTRDSAHILMEGTPAGLDPDAISSDLVANVEGVVDVHHLHAWSLGSGRAVATLHARLAPLADAHAALAGIKARLGSHFDIGHATVQIEPGDCIDEARMDHKHDH
ncbi:MAG: cation diffusion facilitator family transporter [Parvibaculum sp.]|uniref:cation diffusion facilitator family transporter n=1 Tax=Parvibaculum sp. TaxID=2024848 RepID=UPI0025F38455|nr:cation diffusion facilitator family transporter [Parvibaculum sp.]MCE9650803.1 cation diffusion facilitator family transporter [Parvibaculum sp.]